MPAPYDPNQLHGYAEELLECLRMQLALTSGGVPGDVCLRAGADVAWDQCGEGPDCGMAWVRLAQILPVDPFPQPAESVLPAPCATNSFRADFELGVLRCWPTFDGSNTGAPGTCADRTTATRRVHDDAVAMVAAVQCCWAILHEQAGTRWIVGGWTPQGPDGNCVGGTLIVSVEWGICCPEAEPVGLAVTPDTVTVTPEGA